MKLNLLPTYVSKEKTARAGILGMVALIVAGLLLAGGMVFISSSTAAKAKSDALELEPAAARAVSTANEADSVIASAQGILRNIALADQMNRHNSKYVALYDEVKRYIPGFFRVTSMSATSTGQGTAALDLQGVISSYQQYADLMLAMMRVPGAQSVTRSGFNNIDQYIPALTPTDQTGRPVRPGEAPIPDDPLERLDYFIARGSTTGYSGVGNFGGDPTVTRGAMPNASLVTIRVALNRDLQTPDPDATLRGGGAGGGLGTSPTTTSIPTPGNVPPSNTPPAGGGGRGRGQDDDDDE
jgi:Tfp pilus assembly protein PilN